MIGMNFPEFVILLGLSLLSALVIHYGIGYRALRGADGFFAKWVVGWIGAWLGTPVLGHWWGAFGYMNVYIVPALIGAFVGSFMITAMWKANARALPTTYSGTTEMRRAA